MFEIYQGGNTPIVIELEGELPMFTALEASLYMDRLGEIQHWSMEEMERDENSLILPIAEEDSVNYPLGVAVLSLKGLDEGDNVIMYEEASAEIKYKFDKTVMTKKGAKDESNNG